MEADISRICGQDKKRIMKIKIEWDGPKIAEDIKQLVSKEICKKTTDKTYKTKIIDEFEKYLVMLDDDYKKTKEIFKELLPTAKARFTINHGEMYFSFIFFCKQNVWYLQAVHSLLYFSLKPNAGKKTVLLQVDLDDIRQKSKKILGERVKLT